MSGLFVVHSVLRYFVLLDGIVALAFAVAVLLGKPGLEKPFKITTSSYLGLLHTQVLLGLAVLMVRPYYPQLIGHIAMMVLAAVAGQVLVSLGKRKTPMNVRMLLTGIAGSLLLIAGGIFALGRHPFQMTAM